MAFRSSANSAAASRTTRPDPGLARPAAQAGHVVDATAIWRAAQAREAWAEDLLADGLHALAAGLTTLKTIIDPDVIVIGGGLGLAPGFPDALNARIATLDPLYRIALRPAALGAAAGLVGAADLARGSSD